MNGIKKNQFVLFQIPRYCKFCFILKGKMLYLMVYLNLLPLQLQEVLW